MDARDPRYEELDAVMEAASVALSRMQYVECDRQCVRALKMARELEDWPYYARVLLPLQESRRQRRLTAAEGVVRLGTRLLKEPVELWLNYLPEGAVSW